MKESEFETAIESLPRSIKPQRDLWPQISARLESTEHTGDTAQSKGPFWQLPAMAAAVLLMVSLGFFVERGAEDAPTGPTASALAGIALGGTVAATEREYQAAFRELLPLEYSGYRLPGEDSDALQASWHDIQQTEASLLTALQQYPSNVFLNEKLLDLRAQQLRFIKQLALLEQNNWRRT